jgi:Asp-tRNA(Asn)/Glu-tRNA(Gln) amidotransferase A subunit family amidase
MEQGEIAMSAISKPLHYLTIHEAHELLANRSLSPVELTRAILSRIDAVDGQLHAYTRLMADSALAEARIAEAEILKGNYRGPMHGIPVAVKDQLDVRGAPSEIRKLNASATKQIADATAVSKLRHAG